MTMQSLQEALLLEQLAAEEYAGLEAQAAEQEYLYQLATEEAAAAGFDLPTYVAVLQQHEQELAEHAQYQEQQELAELAHYHEQAQLAKLAQYQEQQQLAELAHYQEQQQLAELAQYEALVHASCAGQGEEADPAVLQALAEQEAAAVGMDLATYAAALQQEEAQLAALEEAAYLEGAALHEAEMAQQQAGLPAELLAYLQQVQAAQVQQARALGLL